MSYGLRIIYTGVSDHWPAVFFAQSLTEADGPPLAEPCALIKRFARTSIGADDPLKPPVYTSDLLGRDECGAECLVSAPGHATCRRCLLQPQAGLPSGVGQTP